MGQALHYRVNTVYCDSIKKSREKQACTARSRRWIRGVRRP